MSMETTMKYKPYPAYKESGVEWLGEVPEHWSVKRLSWIFELISSGTTPASDDPSNYGGDIPWVTTGELREEIILNTEKKLTELTLKKYSALKIYPPGTLLIALYGATIGRLGVLGISACTNQACCALVEPISVSSNFIFYVLYTAKGYLLLISSGGGQPNINQDKIRSLRIAVPSIDEQQTIAAFLDRETAKIDTLIAKQERLIELLQEKRTALISYAVTKGLNPDAPMKESGVEWLGEVPEHWEIKSFRHCGWITEGQVNPSDVRYTDLILIAPNHIESGTGKIIYTETANEQVAISGKYPVKAGEIIYSKIRPALNKVCIATEDCLCSADMYPIRPLAGVEAIFIYYLMLCQSFVKLMVDESMRVAMPKVNRETLFACRIPIPPLLEQLKITDFLDRETAKIDILIAKSRQIIDLLKERRTALISAAVTGKIDVREVFPSVTPE